MAHLYRCWLLWARKPITLYRTSDSSYVYLLGVIPWLKKTNATKRSNHALMPCPPFQRHQCGFERGNLRKRRSRRSTAILLLFHSGLKLKFQKVAKTQNWLGKMDRN